MNTQNNFQVRVRFAPSPTGHLHIGSLRTALFNWLFARHHKGIFLVRIEDTDMLRSTQEYEDSLMQSLAWTGITSDEPIIHQKSRMPIYQRIAQQLIDNGNAYKCFCSEEDLQKKREMTTAQTDSYQYDKKCRNRVFSDDDTNKPYVVRFKIQIDSEFFVFTDDIKGQVSIPAEQIDDFVLLRTDGIATYNFAVVQDDFDMKISHVIRGEEHLFNTPKQILLNQALKYNIPKFAHIPLILGASGQKLSKRDGATSVVEYKKEGYLAQALCNYLVRLGWSHGDQEIFSQKEMIDSFSLEHVQHSGAKFDFEKLKWVNSSYVKLLSADQIIAHCHDDLGSDLIADTAGWTESQRNLCVALFQDRVSTVQELYGFVMKSYHMPTSYDWESLRKLIEKDAVIILQLLQQEFMHLDVAMMGFEKHQLSEKIKAFCKAQGYKMSDIAQLLRFAITGSLSGPSVFDLMAILGLKEVQKRISGVIAEF